MEDNMISEEPQVEAVSEEVVAVEEKPVVNEAPKSDVVFNDKPKKNTGMILGMILLLILAAGGIGFGVWAWMDGNAQKEILMRQIGDLKTQINELRQSENNNIDNNIETLGELDDETVLKLLQEAVVDGGYEYIIESAKVYAQYNGDDKTAYWVKYVEVDDDLSESNLNIIFVEDEDGEWSFELPGFSGYTDELLNQYTVL